MPADASTAGDVDMTDHGHAAQLNAASEFGSGGVAVDSPTAVESDVSSLSLSIYIYI